jgi:hypothetical protein
VTWRNQKYVGRIPGINLALSCAILFSGSTPTKALHMLDILGVQSIGYSSFMEHQRNFLQPAVKEVWLAEQKAVLRVAKQAEGGAAVGGDSRCDSPGHCAKFGSYSLMDLQSGKIIDVQLVQVTSILFILNVLFIFLLSFFRATKWVAPTTWSWKASNAAGRP